MGLELVKEIAKLKLRLAMDDAALSGDESFGMMEVLMLDKDPRVRCSGSKKDRITAREALTEVLFERFERQFRN